MNRETQTVSCPLCGGSRVDVLRTLQREEVVREWLDWPGIDIGEEMSALSAMPQWRCRSCGLGFFPPESAGSEALYAALEGFDWYYLPDKWEHAEAMRDIPRGASLLEVGCGRGDFLHRVAEVCGAAPLGLELNAQAMRAARERGLTVESTSVETLAAERAGQFDVMCSFQVLEHLPNPGAHLRAARKLLRPGGRLILGLPNAESFLGLEDNLLDRPPHHVSRWSPDVINAALPALGFRVVRVATEPLPTFQARSFVVARLQWWMSGHLPDAWARLLLNWRIVNALTWLLVRTGVHQRLLGQTFYVMAERL